MDTASTVVELPSTTGLREYFVAQRLAHDPAEICAGSTAPSKDPVVRTITCAWPSTSVIVTDPETPELFCAASVTFADVLADAQALTST